MSWYARRDLRKIHKWGAIIIALPFLVVLVSGLFLQLKKDVAWIQPETIEGVSNIPSITFEQILEKTKSIPDTEVTSWADINRLDVRPDKGTVKVRAINHWEVQIDIQTGEVIQSMYRRSDIIEALHDGSWFSDPVKYWIFLPTGIIVTVLWITGIYMFFLPYFSKRKNRLRKAQLQQDSISSENPL